MEKEFVTYGQALKLKELGFDEPCFGYYSKGVLSIEIIKNGKFFTDEDSIYFEMDSSCLAPTFSQAFRWFREKYQIFPEVLTDCTTEPKFVFTYNKFFGNPKDLTKQEWGWENNIGQYSDIYRTYEDAELACLEKLIEIIKK